MAPPSPRPPRVSRETRLLVLTITVSAIVLLLLARVRFPEPPPTIPAPTPPLERLAARATYDELARSVARLERAIEPALIVLRVAPEAADAPRELSDLLRVAEPPGTAVRHVPALRVGEARAIAAIGPRTRIAGIVGATDPEETAGVVASDPVQRLALVRVPPRPQQTTPQLPLGALATPAYVIAVEGTHAGVTLRPVFVGRGDRFGDPRWTRPLLPLGAVPVTPGALMFTLEGQFLGTVVVEDGALAIAAAQDVLDTVQRLGSGPAAPPADAGIALQPLTGPLAAATGAAVGVVVSGVEEGGPADGLLASGDVITAVDGEAVDSPERLLVLLARREPGAQVRLTARRDAAARDVILLLRPALAAAPPADDAALGLGLEPRVGSVVTAVPPGSAAEAAGLAEGDLIVHAGMFAAPTPAEVRAALRSSTSSHVLLTIRRGGRQRVVAVQVTPPPAADAPR